MKYITITNLVINICLVIAMIITCVIVTNLNKTVSEIKRYSGLDIVKPLVDPVGETISGDEANKLYDSISKELSQWKFNNNYIPMFNMGSDEPSTILVYNKKGECVSQDASTETRTNTLYMMDGNTVFFGKENIAYGYDLDVISQLLNAVNVAKNGSGELVDVPKEDGEDFKNYVIDIHGWDNIKKIYAALDENYSTDYINSLKTALLKIDGADVENTHNRYVFTFDNDTLVAVSNYFYFGANATGNWNTCYSNWGIEKPLVIHDWTLDEFWYNYDYDKMTDDEGAELIKHMQDLTSELSSMLEIVDKESEDTDNDESNNLDKDESKTVDTTKSFEPKDIEVDTNDN